MRKIKKYIVSLGMCAGVLLGCALMQSPTEEQKLQKVYGATVATEATVETSYQYNALFTIPDAKLTYQGQEYTALAKDAILKFPNGNLMSDSSFYLNETGEYTLIYQTVVDGVLVSGEKKFTVNKGLYSFSNSQSTIDYRGSLTCNENVDGMTVKLAKGDTLYFNEAINLQETGETFDFIKFYPYTFSKKAGDATKQECSTMTVRLTDCYDSEIYVEYTLAYHGGHAYFRARSNSQKYSAVDGPKSASYVAYAPRKIVYIDDVRYVARYDDDFGTTSTVSSVSKYANSFDGIGLTFSINPDDYKCSATDAKTLRVTDLRSEDIYSAYNLFEGFTTGEVYLSMWADGYTSDYVHFDIEQIGGYTGNDIVNRVYSDTVAPNITVLGTNGCQDFNIALNEKFTLFGASVQDVNLVGGVNTYVYYKYGTDAQEQVLVVDGAFIPKKEGRYTVVYSAKDTFGNVGRQLLTLTCVETENGKTVAFNVDMPETLEAGKTATLPDYEVYGINGDVTVTCKAVCLADGAETAINTASWQFRPLTIGKYKIVYTCTDKLGSQEFSYEVTSVASDAVVAAGELALPKYFIKGLHYSVDELKVALFSGAQTEYKTGSLEIRQDGTDFEAIGFDDFTITASDKVAFRLVYNGQTIVQTGDYKVIDTGYNTTNFSHTKYFYSDLDDDGSQDFTLTANSQNILCSANKTEGNGKTDYISPLLIESFDFEFAPVVDKSNFQYFALTFTDYYNSQNVHTVTLRNSGEVTYVSFDGGQETRMEKLFSSKHTVEYDAKTQSLVVNKAVNGGVKYSVAGLFSNHKFLFGFECRELSGESAVTLYRLYKQTLSSSKADNSLPQIKVDMPSNSAKKDSLITLSSAAVADMFSPVLRNKITVQVIGPNNQPVTSEEGVVLDGSANALADRVYTVKCDSYGVYAITYIAVDQANKRGVVPFNVNVEDDEAPTIELLDGYQKGCIFTVGKGTTVQVANYAVQDNFGAENVTTHVVVYDCYGVFVNLTEEQTFVANRIGTWQVVYTAYDEIGNYASVRYSVVVK